MNDVLKLKYKVGEIEFEAEGPAEAVEQQRINFMNIVLPAAVNAMVQTHTISEDKAYIETIPQQQLLEAGISDISASSEKKSNADYSRASLPSFLKQYGILNDQDFALFAAYFDEKKNGTKAFSIDSIKKYYQEGRRSTYSNNSELLRQLVKKGYIMDTTTPEDAKTGKYYMLTNDGINYVETYSPREDAVEKRKPRQKAKKAAHSVSEEYISITSDDLNTRNYPVFNSLPGRKAQVIMAMYIVTNEGKGEWFTVDDVIHLLVNVFEIPANASMINSVFTRNKSMFALEQDPENKKPVRRKLLSNAKDYAASIIQDSK